MGLLDAIIGNGSGGGGLLDFLRNNAMNQQMLPAGLPSDQAQYGGGPMAQTPVFAQQNAQPSPLDTAQWPSGPVGAPSSGVPQQPPAVIQAQAQAQAAPAPMAPASESSGGLASGLRGFLANANNGPIGAILGGVAGLAGMGQGSPQQQQAKINNVTAQALLQKGVDPTVVNAAIANPEIMKTLVAQTFGPQPVTSLGNGYVADKSGKVTRAYEPDEKFQHVVVKNPDGSESLQSFDPSTGKYSGGAVQAPSKFSVDPELTGQARLDALKAVDPLYARKIESMVAGDLPMPTGVAALRPDAKRQIEDALAVDGSTSASDFQTRAATRRDYASGIASRVTKSINTTIGHFATLDQTIDKLGNYTYFPRISNAVHDAYSSNMDPAYQKAKATFETNKEAAIKELDYALSGGHSSVSGSAEIRDKFNRADSPETLHAAVTEAMSLLEKRLQSHTKAFTEGTKSQRDPQDFIYPENRQAFSRMLGEKDSGPASTSGALPTGWNYKGSR